jgi:hypothetical protein
VSLFDLLLIENHQRFPTILLGNCERMHGFLGLVFSTHAAYMRKEWTPWPKY